jgi:hypothetical protein
MMMETFTGIDLSLSIDGVRLNELRGDFPRSSAESSAVDGETAATPETAITSPPAPVADPEIASLIALRSGDAQRVHAELRRTRTLTPALTAQVISLLAWDDVTAWASRALAKAAPAVTGKAPRPVARPNEDFAIRGAFPASWEPADHACLRSLLAAMADKPTDRFQSARALARIHELPSLIIDGRHLRGSIERNARRRPSGST